MITKAQLQKDFTRLLTYANGDIVTVGFKGSTAQALRSGIQNSVRNEEMGEIKVLVANLRMLGDALPTMPQDNDVITVDGAEYQVATVSYSSFSATAKIAIVDMDA
jgi:hypothetical protein